MREKVLFDVELELKFLRLSSVFEDTNVGGFFLSFILDECLLELVVEFKIAGWEDLEDGVAIVLEVEEIVVGLILGLDVSEALGG